MTSNEYLTSPLNEQQVMMLRLLKTPLPEEDFTEMRRLAVKLLGKQLDDESDKWEAQTDMTAEKYESLSKGHFRTSSVAAK